MTLADKIIVLNRGKIQQVGEPQEIYAHPINRMVATFLGNPKMNILPAIYAGEVFKVGERVLGYPGFIRDKLQLREGQGLDLGIRPEHINVIEPQRRRERREEEGELFVEVRVIEPLGRETLVRVSLSGLDLPMDVLASGDWCGRVGDRISVQFDLNHLFIFDPASGDTLYPLK
jgi:multiple sugar transport system ATP-binding protein